MKVFYYQSTFCQKIAKVLEEHSNNYYIEDYVITSDNGIYTLFIRYIEKEED